MKPNEAEIKEEVKEMKEMKEMKEERHEAPTEEKHETRKDDEKSEKHETPKPDLEVHVSERFSSKGKSDRKRRGSQEREHKHGSASSLPRRSKDVSIRAFGSRIRFALTQKGRPHCQSSIP
jgi:hypothetical protein